MDLCLALYLMHNVITFHELSIWEKWVSFSTSLFENKLVSNGVWKSHNSNVTYFVRALDIIPDQCLLYRNCDIVKGLLSLLFLATTIYWYICMNTWLFVENTSCYDIVYLKMDFLSVNSSKHGGGMTDTHTTHSVSRSAVVLSRAQCSHAYRAPRLLGRYKYLGFRYLPSSNPPMDKIKHLSSDLSESLVPCNELFLSFYHSQWSAHTLRSN